MKAGIPHFSHRGFVDVRTFFLVPMGRLIFDKRQHGTADSSFFRFLPRVLHANQSIGGRVAATIVEMRVLVSLACMAGFARAFVVPSASLSSSFAQPAARTALSAMGSSRSSSSDGGLSPCPRMSIAIVTVRGVAHARRWSAGCGAAQDPVAFRNYPAYKHESRPIVDDADAKMSPAHVNYFRQNNLTGMHG